METLVAYAQRYLTAMGRAATGFAVPESTEELDVVERLRGDATTDFGAPGISPKADRRPVDDPELRRLKRVLHASWAAFDRATEAAKEARLRKGPRGGGRELPAIVSHVLEADAAYLGRLGGKHRKLDGADVGAEMEAVRGELLDALTARAHGEPLPANRRSKTTWTPRYGVRRSAWHAIDHAWEIEDRAAPA
jgi:DinB family protein